MLRSPAARFHLRLIPSRWYYRDKDPSKEQFLVASKFENEITPIIPQYKVPFLTAICKTSQEFITQHEQLTDIQLQSTLSKCTLYKYTPSISTLLSSVPSLGLSS
jgi:SMC interacting uncharacterized protein involved in chromosome segregation